MKKAFIVLLAALMSTCVWSDEMGVENAPDAKGEVKSVGGKIDVEIPILAWWGIPHAHATVERYREMAEAGFTHCLPPDRGVEENLHHLKLAEEAGIKVVVQDRRMFRDPEAVAMDYKDHPALGAYHIKDEPGAKEFTRIGDVVRRLSEVDPLHPSYINLLPTYADNKLLQADGYEDYLRQYMEIVQPEFLSYDNYIIYGNSYREREFYRNLWIIRNWAEDHAIPFWAFVMVTAHGPYLEPEEGDIRFQAFASLAYGAGGIQYFTYWTPSGRPDHRFHSGPIGPEGERNPVYDRIKRVNRDIHALAPHLSKLTSRGVYLAPSLPSKSSREFHDENLPNSVTSINGDAVVLGDFIDEQQTEYLLVVNRSPKDAATVTLAFAEDVVAVHEVSASVRDYELVALQAIEGSHAVRLNLVPGDGRLLMIRKME